MIVEKKEMDVSSYALLYMFSVSLCVLFVCAVCGHAPHNGVLRKWVLTLHGSKVTQEDIDQRRRYMGESERWYC